MGRRSPPRMKVLKTGLARWVRFGAPRMMKVGGVAPGRERDGLLQRRKDGVRAVSGDGGFFAQSRLPNPPKKGLVRKKSFDTSDLSPLRPGRGLRNQMHVGVLRGEDSGGESSVVVGAGGSVVWVWPNSNVQGTRWEAPRGSMLDYHFDSWNSAW